MWKLYLFDLLHPKYVFLFKKGGKDPGELKESFPSLNLMLLYWFKTVISALCGLTVDFSITCGQVFQ